MNLPHLTDEDILAAWKMYEEAEPDISTERLLEMTAWFCHCDAGDVADVLYRKGRS